MISIYRFVILGLVFGDIVLSQPMDFLLSDYIVDRKLLVSIPTTSELSNCSMKLRLDSKKAYVNL